VMDPAADEDWFTVQVSPDPQATLPEAVAVSVYFASHDVTGVVHC